MTGGGRVLSGLEIAALSLPSFVFAGYELARKTYLPAWLVHGGGLSLAMTGSILTVMAIWSVLIELGFGMISDIPVFGLGRRRFWILAGTALLTAAGVCLLFARRGMPVWFWIVSLLGLAGGWVLTNLTHGAWALEAGNGPIARGRIFGWRMQAGIGGGMVFSLMAALPGAFRTGSSAEPFIFILGLTLLGAPLAHGLLVVAVHEFETDRRDHRAGGRWSLSHLLEPLRVCIATPADRTLAALFGLVGARGALLGTGFLFMTRDALCLPHWSAMLVTIQTLAAALGIAIALTLIRHHSPQRLLVLTFIGNFGLAAVLPLLPAGLPAPLIMWSACSGLISPIDFLLLRILLGARLDEGGRHQEAAPQAAAYYAGFHLPFNLAAALSLTIAFRIYDWAGFVPESTSGASAWWALQLIPACLAASLSGLGLVALAGLVKCQKATGKSVPIGRKRSMGN